MSNKRFAEEFKIEAVKRRVLIHGPTIQNQAQTTPSVVANTCKPRKNVRVVSDIGSDPGSVALKFGPKIHDKQVKASKAIRNNPIHAHATTGLAFAPAKALFLLSKPLARFAACARVDIVSLLLTSCKGAFLLPAIRYNAPSA